MNWSQLNKAITAAHRAGNFRLVDELETERHFRKVAAENRRELEADRKPDLSRRSFRG